MYSVAYLSLWRKTIHRGLIQINRLEVISWSKTALVVVTGVIAFIHILLIPQRLLEREVCAIAFMIASALAHIIAPIIQLTAADPSQYIFCFALLMLFGDIVKLAFLKIEDEFQVHMLSRQNLIFLTSFTAFLYFATLILQGLQWSIDLVVVAVSVCVCVCLWCLTSAIVKAPYVH